MYLQRYAIIIKVHGVRWKKQGETESSVILRSLRGQSLTPGQAVVLYDGEHVLGGRNHTMRLDHSMIQCDYHMHTEFSTDSEASVKSMLDASWSGGFGQYVSQIIWIWIIRRTKNWGRSRFSLI